MNRQFQWCPKFMFICALILGLSIFPAGFDADAQSAGTAFIVDDNLASKLSLSGPDAMGAVTVHPDTDRPLKTAVPNSKVRGAVPAADRIATLKAKLGRSRSSHSPITTAQRENLLQLMADAPGGEAVQVAFDQANGTPTFIKLKAFTKGSRLSRQQAPALTDTVARQFLRTHRQLLKLDDPDQNLVLSKSWLGSQGARHFKYQQMVNDIPVYGKQLLVHVDDSDAVYLLNGRFEPTPRMLPTAPAITPDQALAAVRAHLGLPGLAAGGAIELVVYTRATGEMALSYVVPVKPSLSEGWIYFINAMDTGVIHRMTQIQSDVVTASGVDLNSVNQSFNAWRQGGTYYLVDPSMPLATYPDLDYVASIQSPGNTYVITADNSDGSSLYHISSASSGSGWDAAGVSAMAHINKVYDYYKTAFGRNGLDDANRNYMAVVHLEEDFANAFWNGTYIVFGDGDNQTFSNLAASLDITAHEIQHGITEFTANLKYENQSGALNEAYSDLFACMVDDDDWTVGEDCTIPSPGYLRNLADPTQGLSVLPRNMSEYQNLPNTEDGDWGGVHINMSIGSRAGYLMAQGLGSTAIGREKTAAIWYRALTTYLTPYAQFADARSAMITSAEDLYGAASSEVAAVQAAWDTVGVVTTGGTRPTPGDPVSGDDIMLYLYPIDDSHNPYTADEHYALCALLDPGNGYLVENDIWPLNDVSSYANYPRYTKTAAYTDGDGDTIIFYATEDFDLHDVILYADGTYDPSEEVLDTKDFYSIALSPDGRYFAYTKPDATDNHIYVLDLVEERNGAFLIEPITDTEVSTDAFNTIVYADSMSFDFASKTLSFDALNCITTADSSCSEGNGYRYWSIGFLALADDPDDTDAVQGTLSFPFPNQSPQYDVSYPAFAANNSFVLAVDYHDYSLYSTYGIVDSIVLTLNGRDGDSRDVVNPNRGTNDHGVFGVPTFWGDDDAITIQWLDDTDGSADRVPIDTDWAGPADIAYVDDGRTIDSLNDYAAAMPVMHRVAARSVSGQISFSAQALDFGDTAVGAQATQNLTLSNDGARDIRILDIALSGGGQFTHNGTNGLLPRSGQMVITVSYSPKTAGSTSATLSVTSDADVPTTMISITGNAPDGGGGGGGGGCMISMLHDEHDEHDEAHDSGIAVLIGAMMACVLVGVLLAWGAAGSRTRPTRPRG